MKKSFLIGLFALLFTACFDNTSSENKSNFFEKSELSKLDCDLNIKPCYIKFKDKNIKFEFTQLPIYTMKPVVFKITGLEELGIKEPSLEFYGLNMDMGKIKAKLKKDKKSFIAKIVLSACIINTMRYRFEVLDGGRKIGLFIDFDLKI